MVPLKFQPGQLTDEIKFGFFLTGFSWWPSYMNDINDIPKKYIIIRVSRQINITFIRDICYQTSRHLKQNKSLGHDKLFSSVLKTCKMEPIEPPY